MTSPDQLPNDFWSEVTELDKHLHLNAPNRNITDAASKATDFWERIVVRGEQLLDETFDADETMVISWKSIHKLGGSLIRGALGVYRGVGQEGAIETRFAYLYYADDPQSSRLAVAILGHDSLLETSPPGVLAERRAHYSQAMREGRLAPTIEQRNYFLEEMHRGASGNYRVR